MICDFPTIFSDRWGSNLEALKRGLRRAALRVVWLVGGLGHDDDGRGGRARRRTGFSFARSFVTIEFDWRSLPFPPSLSPTRLLNTETLPTGLVNLLSVSSYPPLMPDRKVTLTRELAITKLLTRLSKPGECARGGIPFSRPWGPRNVAP